MVADSWLLLWTQPRWLLENVEYSVGAENTVAAGFANLLNDFQPD
jgi:hypothetical protein